MSFPILPALLSALFLAGGTGVAVTAASSNAPGKARSERAGKPEAKRSKAMGLCAQIECTPEQKAEIAKLREQIKADRKADHEELKKLRKDLAAEFRNGKLDRAKMASIYSKIDRLRAEHAGERREMLEDVHGVLDEEQRDRIADRIEARGEAGALSGHGKGKGGAGKAGKAKKAGKTERAAR